MERRVRWEDVPDLSKEPRLLDPACKAGPQIALGWKVRRHRKSSIAIDASTLDGTALLSQSVRTIVEANMEYYREQLKSETDNVKRKTIVRLLAEEEEKFASVVGAREKRGA